MAGRNGWSYPITSPLELGYSVRRELCHFQWIVFKNSCFFFKVSWSLRNYISLNLLNSFRVVWWNQLLMLDEYAWLIILSDLTVKKTLVNGQSLATQIAISTSNRYVMLCLQTRYMNWFRAGFLFRFDNTLGFFVLHFCPNWILHLFVAHFVSLLA